MKARLLIFLSFPLILFFSAAAYGQQVSARYITATGSVIKLQLTIKNPAPLNVIVEQYIPPGTKIVSTSPRVRQNNAKNGVVKWLIKGLNPGKRVITLKVSPPLSSNAQGRLTYRHPQNGNLIEKSF